MPRLLDGMPCGNIGYLSCQGKQSTPSSSLLLFSILFSIVVLADLSKGDMNKLL